VLGCGGLLPQQFDTDISDHPQDRAAQPFGLLAVKSGDGAAIFLDRERQHLAVRGGAAPRDPGFDKAGIARSRPAPKKPPALEPRHQRFTLGCGITVASASCDKVIPSWAASTASTRHSWNE
jgi:hypothetical protein